MRKTMAVTLALVLVAAVVWAQPGPGPNCPQAPMAPMAPGMGQGCGMQGGHGMMGHKGMGCGMQGGRMGHGMGAGIGIEQFREELDLSDQQLADLEQIRLQHQMGMIDARAEIEKTELRLRDLMGDENASTQEVEQGIDRLAELRARIQKEQYRHRQECHSVLTDAQLEKLEQLREERRGDRRELRQENRQENRPQFRGRRSGSSS